MPKGQNKHLTKGQSPPQEQEVCPRSRPYLLVQNSGCIHLSHHITRGPFLSRTEILQHGLSLKLFIFEHYVTFQVIIKKKFPSPLATGKY